MHLRPCRNSRPEVFLGKGVLKICSKFTGVHPCQSAISIKLLYNFIKITLWHGCSPVNLLLNFRTTFLKNTSGGLLLKESAVLSSKFFLGNPTLLDFVCKQGMGLIEKRQIVIEQLNQ